MKKCRRRTEALMWHECTLYSANNENTQAWTEMQTHAEWKSINALMEQINSCCRIISCRSDTIPTSLLLIKQGSHWHALINDLWMLFIFHITTALQMWLSPPWRAKDRRVPSVSRPGFNPNFTTFSYFKTNWIGFVYSAIQVPWNIVKLIFVFLVFWALTYFRISCDSTLWSSNIEKSISNCPDHKDWDVYDSSFQ